MADDPKYVLLPLETEGFAKNDEDDQPGIALGRIIEGDAFSKASATLRGWRVEASDPEPKPIREAQLPNDTALDLAALAEEARRLTASVGATVADITARCAAIR